MHPTLFVKCGIPATGKTTLANRLVEEGVHVIGRDEIRRIFGDYSRVKEWHVVKIIEHSVKATILDGRHVLVDANHASITQRAQVLNWLKDLRSLHGTCSPGVILSYRCDLATCIERDSNREPSVGEDVVRKQFESYSPPTIAEGASVLHVDAMSTRVSEILQSWPVPQEMTIR